MLRSRVGLPILCSKISDIEGGRSRFSAKSRHIGCGEHSVGQEEGETFNEYVLCARDLDK